MKPDKPSGRERIQHILDAILIIQNLTEGYSSDDFERDIKTYYACLYQYAVIGEAIGKIETSILQKYDYPWHKVRSFRNFVIHEYHAIDIRVVWDTTRLILPDFRELLERIMENEFPSAS